MSQEPFFDFFPAEGQQYYSSSIGNMGQRAQNSEMRSGGPYNQIQNPQQKAVFSHKQQLQQQQQQQQRILPIRQLQTKQTKDFQSSGMHEPNTKDKIDQPPPNSFASGQFVPGSSPSSNSMRSYSSLGEQSVTTAVSSEPAAHNTYAKVTDVNMSDGPVHKDVQSIKDNEDENELGSDKGKKDGASTKKHARKKLSNQELYQRRKAQNRAAQRAFRERKEGKLRDLSEQLSAVQAEKEKLQRQLEEVKQRNMFLDMENKFLQEKGHFMNKDGVTQATASPTDASGSTSSGSPQSANGSFVFPKYTREKFINGSVDMGKHTWGKDKFRSKTYEVDNAAVLTVGAVWDYLVEFAKMNEEISIDMPGVMSDLRGKEVCHGFGPAYKLRLVNETLQRHICNK